MTRASKGSVWSLRLARAVVLSTGLSLGIIGTTMSAVAATTQPTNLNVSLSLPQTATAGIAYHGTMTATAAGLNGCYRWNVQGLPAGLGLSSALSCISPGAAGSASLTISTSVTGIPASPAGAGFAQTVTVTLEAVGDSQASAPATGPVAGQATATILVLPSPWANSTASDTYAGTGLSLISCVSGPTCWVVGHSTNPPPPPVQVSSSSTSTSTTTTIALVPSKSVSTPDETGSLPVSVTGTIPGTSTNIGLVEGGTFVASVDQISPLKLGVVRAGIPMSITAIACPTSSTCVMVGSEIDSSGVPVPATLLMTESGTTWSAETMALQAPYVSGSLTAVVCPNPDSCIATGTAQQSSASAGFAVPIALSSQGSSEVATFANVSYLPQMASQLADISCANVFDCIAAGKSSTSTGVTSSSLVIRTTNGGQSWQADQHIGPDATNPGKNPQTALQPWVPTVDGPLVFGGIVGVGCAPGGSTNSCEVSWPFWPAQANTPNGVDWYSNVLSAGNIGGMGSSISCPTKGHCFSVVTTGVECAYGTVCNVSQILETIPSSSIWEVGIAGEGPSFHDNSALSSISCPSVTTCVAVGQWYPRRAASWSPQFPLVMSPQLAIHPFFQPPPPPSLFTASNLGLALGVISLFTGFGEVADALGGIAYLAGAASLALGGMTVANGDTIGWLSIAMGVFGLVSYPMSIASTVLSVADVPLAPSSPPTPSVTLPSALEDVPTPESTGEGLGGPSWTTPTATNTTDSEPGVGGDG